MAVTPQGLERALATHRIRPIGSLHNNSSGHAAEAVIGRPGVYSIRPEKIRLDDDLGQPAADGHTTATGTVSNVVYAGAAMRYEVSLDAGGQLSVLRQNAEPNPADGPRRGGDRVRLSWRLEHNVRVPDAR